MSLTKKDFMALAKMIYHFDTDGTNSQNNIKDQIAQDIATFCAGQNPRFNRARFLAACGVKDEN